MQTLTYGRKKPETGDDSVGTNGWFNALAGNVAADDAHSHNGTDSARIDSTSVDSFTTTTGTSWGTTIGSGLYRMSIAMPAGRDFDKYMILFKDASGQQVFLEVTKIDSSNFYVKTNDNTANYTVLFIS